MTAPIDTGAPLADSAGSLSSNSAPTADKQAPAGDRRKQDVSAARPEDPKKEAWQKVLENDFKLKHLGLVAVLLWIFSLHAAGIYFFTKGFLLTRMVLENKSTCDVLPWDDNAATPAVSTGDADRGCWHPKTFDKAIFIIIDALRYDFTVPFRPAAEGDRPHLFHDKIPVLYETAVQSPNKAFLRPFIADPPTTTLQRLKGLTTGTLPTFVDAGSNFAGTAIDEDNIVAQLRAAGKKLVHLGDDTWHALFPDYFDPNLTRPFDSFNVWDLHTVDDGVNTHLFPLLHPDNATKWDVIFGHYLGVDHAGHRYGPDHTAMAAKLQQMDQVIRDLIDRIDDNTLLIVMGDHGMDSKGDHGGESDDEVEAALWMYSKKGVFGRTHPDLVTPPQTAKEHAIPQIDIVPTLSLLLGIPIPFNNLGSPIEEAFVGHSGKDWKNLAAVNRLTSAQIKRYQHQYAIARGMSDDQTSGPLSLWSQAELQWNALGKQGSNDQLRAAYDAYREYQRRTLNVCRGLWARFDIPSMIEGVLLLFGGLLILIFYARGLRVERTQITALLLSRIGLGLGIGAGAGLLATVAGLGDAAAWERMALAAAVGSMLAAASTLFWIPGKLRLPLPRSVWSWFCFFVTVSQSIGFASNSYTIWEDEIMLFFLTTFGVLAGVSSMRQKSTSDRVLGVYHSILFVLLGRLASVSRLCREEQMPYCRSTYYASATSSTSAPWQLAIPFVVAAILPSVVRSFYAGSKSYEGTATFWIGFAFRAGLFLSAIYWTLEAADDGDWAGGISTTRLKTVRVLIAQVGLAVALAAGTTMFIWGKPCVSINIATSTDEASSEKRTTVTILGFANVHGTRFFLLVLNVYLAAALVSKPMGQGALALQLLQTLSLLEILDTNGMTTPGATSVVGPIVLGLLGSFHYFKTGHQATLSSIQWESAFVALTTVRYPWSPLLVVLNTLGAQIISAVAVPVAVLWKRPIDSERFNPSSSSSSSSSSARLLSDVAQAVTTHLLYHATINLATTMWAGHLRRHLMLYRIFSPRFMLGAVVLLVVDLILALVAVGFGVRWNTLSVAEVFGW
ncbi:hypothetical protein VTN49DRAFT_2477 [Thermomyces lanuginosus]|uniref:uncharacterized protein n=1 Tax=Thermomyces lanuginosus TaxID=5541 RepID=UPI0037441B61